jgi:hypothetical protein
MTNARIALYALILAFTVVAGCSSSKTRPDDTAVAPAATSAPADHTTNPDTLDLGASSAGRAR